MKPSPFRGLHGKRKLPGEFSGVVKTYPKRLRVDKTVRKTTSQDTCCVCLGLYRDDIDDIDEKTGNVLPEHDWNTIGTRLEHDWNTIGTRLEHDWNTIGTRVEHDWNTIGFGAVRMTGHVKCLEDSAEGFVCSICQNVKMCLCR